MSQLMRSNADSKAETCRLTHSDRQFKDGPGCHDRQWKTLMQDLISTHNIGCLTPMIVIPDVDRSTTLTMYSSRAFRCVTQHLSEKVRSSQIQCCTSSPA